MCGKRVKFINRLTRHLNTCKNHLYSKSQPLFQPPQYKSYKKEDTLGRNKEDDSDLLCKIVTTATVNSIFEMLIEDMPQKKLFANKSLLAL